jgi:hypothetical protein
LLLAIGSGFDVQLDDQVLGIVSGALQAAGLALVTVSLFAASTSGLLRARSIKSAIRGVALLSAAGVSAAIVAGLVFTPDGTLKGLRIGAAITETIFALGLGGLAWATWTRIVELVSRPASPDADGPPWPTNEATATG